MEKHLYFAITERAQYRSFLHKNEEKTDTPFTLRSQGNIPEGGRGLHKTWSSFQKSAFSSRRKQVKMFHISSD